MADFSSLKQTIQTYIKQNGNEEITGNILQDVLLAMVSTMGDSAINGLVSALQDEITARQNQDGTLQGNITAEATARQQADTALGGRIDGLQTTINGINTKLAEGYIYAGIATPSTNPGTSSGKVFYIAVSSGTYTNFSNLTVAQGINILKYNGSAWSKDVVYTIDARPKKNSQNFVTSGGVFDNIGALDVSELNATENPHTLAQYADLSAALAAIPTDYQKGGMSVKFVHSIDNKYVQYRLMSESFSTIETDWLSSDTLNDGIFIHDAIKDSVQQVGAYIVYSTGQLVDTSSYNTSRSVYKFSVERGRYSKVIARTVNGDRVPASIAFYRTTLPKTSGYISGVQIETTPTIQEADIPADCVLICVTNRTEQLSNPVFNVQSSIDSINNRIFTLEDEVNNLNDEVNDFNNITQKLSDELELYNESLMYEPLKSIHIDDGGNAVDYSNLRWFSNINLNIGNRAYRNKKVVGMKLWARIPGQISITKGSNIAINNTEYSNQILKTFDVVAGLNTLYLDKPVICTEATDYIGIDGNVTIGYYKDYSSPTNVAYYYYVENDGEIKFSTKDACVAIICIDAVSSESVTLIEKNVEDLTNKSKLIHFDWLDYPYYYHWNPNGFIDGIPSQSVEDNLLAKRLGFKFVEVNSQPTATPGKYIVTHGASGKFGEEFPEEYRDIQISSMEYSDIVANVKYGSIYDCYNHTVSTAEAFFKNCAQLSLGLYLRNNSNDLVELARKYVQDDYIIIPGGSSVRTRLGFMGILTTYIGGNNSEEVCNIAYLRNHVNSNGGAPYHIVLVGTHVDYMITNGTLDEIVSTLRAEGIFIGGCYCSTASLEKLTAVGGCGHAASIGQCNSFSDANFGSWSPLDSDLSNWTIPNDITISGGRIINNTNNTLTVITPSTGIIPLAKSQIQARVKGSITFSIGEIRNIQYSNYDENIPINLNIAGINKDMKLTIVLGANSSVEFLNLQVSRC